MPLYYAMRFVTEATRNFAEMVSVVEKTTNPLIKIFAFRQGLNAGSDFRSQTSEVRVVILHKDYNATSPTSVNISITTQHSPYAGHYIVLKADSIFSNFGLTYAGQTYDDSRDGMPMGRFISQSVQADSSGVYHLLVQPASAVLLTIASSAPNQDREIIVSD